MIEPQGMPATHTVLARLSEAGRRALATCEGSLRLNAGDTVLSEGQPTPFLAVVESGRVAVRLRAPGAAAPATVLTVEPGELLGWSAVVPPYRTTADAIATTPAAILTFEASALRRLLAEDHDLAAELLPLILESVAARLGASWDQLLDLFAPPVVEPW
jgi:CRP-like cAMP-binding protein